MQLKNFDWYYIFSMSAMAVLTWVLGFVSRGGFTKSYQYPLVIMVFLMAMIIIKKSTIGIYKEIGRRERD